MFKQILSTNFGRVLLLCGVALSSGCAEDDFAEDDFAEDDFAEDDFTGDDSTENDFAEEEFRALAIGLHGSVPNPKVTTGGVVNQALVKGIPANPQQQFWGFCGQSSAATAINFARGTSPNDATKKSQLQWFHERLLARESGYSYNDPAGKYVANIYWLYTLLRDEKSDEFTVAWHTTSNRDLIKERMATALDGGAFVVAVNKTSDNGVGHYLTVYAIDYQPNQAGGGMVYYGDVLYGTLGKVNFTTFLDRMLSQSNMGLYNAFSVKKK